MAQIAELAEFQSEPVPKLDLEAFVEFVDAVYVEGRIVVLLLVVGQIANAVAGPVGLLFIRTDSQHVNAVDNWILVVSDVA
jgi:hypothetical protein